MRAPIGRDKTSDLRMSLKSRTIAADDAPNPEIVSMLPRLASTLEWGSEHPLAAARDEFQLGVGDRQCAAFAMRERVTPTRGP